MNKEAFVFMLVSEVIIATITIYFFVKVFRSKNKFNSESSHDIENNTE